MQNKYRIFHTFFITIFLILLLAINPTAKVIKADNNNTQNSNHIVVKLSTSSNIQVIASKYGLTVLSSINNNSFLLSIPNNTDINTLISNISSESGVIVAEANTDITTPLISLRQPVNFPGGDPIGGNLDYNAYKYQPLNILWQLDTVQTVSKGRGVKIAVIDTGIDLQHPDLVGHISLDGYDFIDNDSIPNDEHGGPSYGHGTFIAGLIALVAPEAQILPLRVINPSGYGNAFEVAAAIRYAVDHGAKVINLSLGGDEQSTVIKDQLDYAKSKKCLVLAAVGNTNSNMETIFPACSGNVFAVSAVDINYLKADFSNYGSDVDFASIGVDLISTFPNNSYAKWSGTSFATPLVAAEAALILQIKPSTVSLDSVIKETAIKIDNLQPSTYKGKLGCGVVSPLKAINYLRNK